MGNFLSIAETLDTILNNCSTVVIILGVVKFLSITEQMHDLNEECEQLEQGETGSVEKKGTRLIHMYENLIKFYNVITAS